MKVYHATLRRNVKSIMEGGIDPAYTKGKLVACWFHTRSQSAWAVIHTVGRHGGSPRDVVVLELDVPRSWLRRSSSRGLWYCARIVPYSRVRAVEGFEIVSKSPLEV